MQSNSIYTFFPFQATNDQNNALLAMQNFIADDETSDFLIMSGAAGTGKTSVTSALVGLLNNQGREYKICAPTGRAAKILGRKANSVASTIHSLIYNCVTDEQGISHWELKTNAIADPCIYVIDEASMIQAISTSQPDDLYQYASPVLTSLFHFIKSGNKANKIVILGDKNQLAPVHETVSRALMPDYLEKCYHLTGKAVFLSEIHRQEENSSILKNAQQIVSSIENTGNPLGNLIGFKYKYMDDAASVFARNFSIDDYEDSICICHTHAQNNFMNNSIRMNLFGGLVPLLTPGDLLIVNRNYKKGSKLLYNGDHVVLREIDWESKMIIAGLTFVPVKIAHDGAEIEDFLCQEILTNKNHQLTAEQSKALWADRKRRNRIFQDSNNIDDDRYLSCLHLSYGYSITCHKAQGGEWKRVYVNTFGVRDLRWMYTAVTRASQTLEFL